MIWSNSKIFRELFTKSFKNHLLTIKFVEPSLFAETLKFDNSLVVTSNSSFNLEFSSTRDEICSDSLNTNSVFVDDRLFCGSGGEVSFCSKFGLLSEIRFFEPVGETQIFTE